MPAHITVQPGGFEDCALHLAGYAHALSKPDPVGLERHRRINLEATQNPFAALRA